MRLHFDRRGIAVPITIALAILLMACCQTKAATTLYAGFDGNFSTASGTDFTSDGNTTQAFVTGPGVTQGTQALSITQPKSPPQLVDMKDITLNNAALVAANNRILMDVTVPQN